MSKLTDRKAIFLALHDAIAWQISRASAYSHIEGSPERAEALDMIKHYKAILRERYGSDTHAGEERIKRAGTVTLDELCKRKPL